MVTEQNSPDPGAIVGRSYTRARRFPLVIGQLPGGGRLLGGPYTLTQIGVMSASVLVLYLAAPIWAHLGLANVIVLIGVPYAAAWLVRHARVEGREPLRAAAGFAVWLCSPATGRIRGVVVRPHRPRRQVAGRFTVTAPAAAPAPAAAAGPVLPEPVRPPRRAAAAPRTAPRPAPVLAEPARAHRQAPSSGLDRLKAAAGSRP